MLQLQEVSCSWAPVLIGDFNYLDIFWHSGMEGGRQCRRFLESVEDDFLVQVLDRPSRGEALLHLVLARVKESIREVKTAGSLNCNDHAVVEFVIWRNAGLAKSRIRALSFRRANFWLIKELLGGISWESILEGMGTEQSWPLCQDTFLRAQERSIPEQKKRSRGGG